MKIALQNGTVYIKDASPAQAAALKSWGLFQYDRKTGIYSGAETLELLSRVYKLTKALPEPLMKELRRLQAVQDAVDVLRTEKDPKPLTKFPVKPKLYQHQIRAADMALVTFGLIPPEEVLKGREK